MLPSSILSLIVLLPMLGAAAIGIIGFINKDFRKQEKLIGAFATLMVLIPFLIVAYTFFTFQHGQSQEFGLLFGEPLGWLWGLMGKDGTTTGIDFMYNLDEISLTMAMIVTGVGSLIHIYSIGYMHGDRSYYKFFLYLNLFIFAMLNLILGQNLVVLFLGWEGVGACSYFLIGYWYEDMNKAKAAQKAFVANRIGDFAMLVAMFLLYQNVGSLNFYDISEYFQNAHALHGAGMHDMASHAIGVMEPGKLAAWVGVLALVAATGKSAQIPLYVWLPDAMAGPTPVSALIHAATMVTSGIYLIARLSPAYEMAPEIMILVCFVGAFTAILAALIAVAQNDIKKVLAYSTVSQLGFMFMALGAGAYTTAIFHVMTHAFFKACLFLGSGSVIHAMEHMHTVDDPQDVRTMGGLKKYLPHTHITFFISTLAIAGIPLLAGFFSKDEILSNVFARGLADSADGGTIWYFFIWGIGMLTAFLTAFYMTRVYFLTFRGKERFPHDHHPHENPPVMYIPLYVLALLAIVGGYVGLPAVVGDHHLFNHNMEAGYFIGSGGQQVPIIGTHVMHGNHHLLEHTLPNYGMEWILIIVSILIAVAGVLISWRLYTKHDAAGDNVLKKILGKFYTRMENKFYVDEFYQKWIIDPFVWAGTNIIMVIDKQVIDGAVNGIGNVVMSVGGFFKKIQSGFVSQYALILVLGVVLIMGFLVFG